MSLSPVLNEQVSRITAEIVKAWHDGAAQVVLWGAGGCGKSTARRNAFKIIQRINPSAQTAVLYERNQPADAATFRVYETNCYVNPNDWEGSVVISC